MAKPIFDMYGNELQVGDLIMITEKANSKESRPSIIFRHILAFDRGMITIEHTRSSWTPPWPLNIRPKSSEVRKVTGAFAEAWKTGDLFRML